MPFNWSDYRIVAATLSQNTDEGSQRTAISRAYYCAYHQALSHIQEHSSGFQYSEGRPAHDQVWREFEDKGRSYWEVWDKGNKLKRLRVDADYRPDATINNNTAVLSLKLADRIVEVLQDIHQKKLVVAQPGETSERL
jgi:uncharacterized protein (UPF0332 family)